MEPYKFYKEFFDSSFCSEVIRNFKDNSTYEPRGKWNSWTVKNNEYKKYLLKKVESITPAGIFNSWINITVYEPGGKLRIHKDLRSEHTIVINLNQDYIGGDFLIESKKLNLGVGDTLVFNGGKIEHGVDQVLEGIRYSLNFWFTFDKYKINKDKKTLV